VRDSLIEHAALDKRVYEIVTAEALANKQPLHKAVLQDILKDSAFYKTKK